MQKFTHSLARRASFQMVRYYGWYSNKSRGLREKQGIAMTGDDSQEKHEEHVEIIDVSEYKPRLPAQKPLLKTMNWFMNSSTICLRSTYRQMIDPVMMNPVLRKIKPFLSCRPFHFLSLSIFNKADKIKKSCNFLCFC